jgi:hypothetical protein
MPGKQRVPLGVVGPSSKAYSEAQQSARTVNLIPEVNDADAKAVIALRAAPGFFRWADLSALVPSGAEIRGLHMMGERFFAVVGPKIVEVNRDLTLGSFSTITEFASLATSSGKVGISDNNAKLIVGDGTGFFALDLDTHTLTPILDDPGGGEPIVGYVSAWLDGTTLYFERDSSKYWYSALNDATTVNGLAFFSAEFNPDNTVGAHVVNGEIVILGQKSTEDHWDSGDADNPFQRISGGHIEYGCVGRWASCKLGNSVAMVGRSEQGQGIVYRLGGAGSQPVRISTPAVEKCIEKVLFAFNDVTELITLWAYADAGHEYLVVNLPAVPATNNNPAQPSMTWCFDTVTGLWHERGYTNPATGQYERILSDFHVLYNGRHYTGDYQHPYIYEMAHDYFRENTIPLVKTRECPHLYMQGRRFAVNRLEVVGETGAGRDGSATGGTDPQLVIQYRWDGKPWSNEVWRSWGKLGVPQTRALFGPCGSGIDFELRVVCSEPIRFVLTGGWADVTVGR